MIPAVQCFRLIWPVVCAIALFAAVPFIVLTGASTGLIEIPLFGISTLKIPLTNIVLLRGAVIIAGCAILAIPAFRDYSGLFPDEYRIVAFFDTKGLLQALAQLSERDRSCLNIAPDWTVHRRKYFEELNKFIKSHLHPVFQFKPEIRHVHSIGQTSFEVKAVKGWQQYRVKDARGTLKHCLEVPGAKEITILSEFCILNTPTNHIQASLTDIYFRGALLVCPRFKQVAKLSGSDTDLYHHDLICATKVRFFPVPSVGRTIYFVEDDDEQTYPVAYAINYPA